MPRPGQLLETLTRSKIPVGVRPATLTWAEQIQNSQFYYSACPIPNLAWVSTERLALSITPGLDGTEAERSRSVNPKSFD